MSLRTKLVLFAVSLALSGCTFESSNSHNSDSAQDNNQSQPPLVNPVQVPEPTFGSKNKRNEFVRCDFAEINRFSYADNEDPIESTRYYTTQTRRQVEVSDDGSTKKIIAEGVYTDAVRSYSFKNVKLEKIIENTSTSKKVRMTGQYQKTWVSGLSLSKSQKEKQTFDYTETYLIKGESQFLIKVEEHIARTSFEFKPQFEELEQVQDGKTIFVKRLISPITEYDKETKQTKKTIYSVETCVTNQLP